MSEYEKGSPCGECNRTTCKGTAIAFHRGNGMWYCRSCAVELNRIHKRDAQALYGADLLIIPEDHRPEGSA